MMAFYNLMNDGICKIHNFKIICDIVRIYISKINSKLDKTGNFVSKPTQTIVLSRGHVFK